MQVLWYITMIVDAIYFIIGTMIVMGAEVGDKSFKKGLAALFVGGAIILLGGVLIPHTNTRTPDSTPSQAITSTLTEE